MRGSDSFFAIGVASVLSAAFSTWRLLPPANAADAKMNSIVRASVTSTKPDSEGRQDVTIKLTIKEGHRILANPVQCDDLVLAQTTVTIASATKLQDVKIEYPAGKRKKLFGDVVFYIYEGEIEIKGQVKRLAGGAAPLDVAIECFPRDDARVYLPEKIKVQVK
jgi:hypothetical protein